MQERGNGPWKQLPTYAPSRCAQTKKTEHSAGIRTAALGVQTSQLPQLASASWSAAVSTASRSKCIADLSFVPVLLLAPILLA